MEIRSHRNNPPQTVWAALFMALLTALMARWSDEPVFSRQALFGLAGLFALIGMGVWCWRPRRSVRFDSRRQTVVVLDQTRWSHRLRQIGFRDVAAVSVRSWQDPDPDIRPMKRVEHWVVLQTRQGEEIELTDRMQNEAEARQLGARVTQLMQVGLQSVQNRTFDRAPDL
ncbi:MAG: hypothetical protein EKK45_28820 [Curvibacter sp.]|nr:MAG: hypothetical protein EKK45_28820 [Curvibacter sp.]